MQRSAPLGLLVLAIVAFFYLGRIEKTTSWGYVQDSTSHANQVAASADASSSALSEAIKAIQSEEEREKSQTGPNTAEASGTTSGQRNSFLSDQKQLLASVKAQQDKLAASALASSPNPATAPSGVTSYMPIIVTTVFGVAALWIILWKGYRGDVEARKWAFGILGVIVGYWLKG